jgi:hypothetical protein
MKHWPSRAIKTKKDVHKFTRITQIKGETSRVKNYGSDAV